MDGDLLYHVILRWYRQVNMIHFPLKTSLLDHLQASTTLTVDIPSLVGPATTSAVTYNNQDVTLRDFV